VTRNQQGKMTELATQFRQMIENADRSILPIEFEKFPTGSCGRASKSLAPYLIDAPIRTADIMSS